MTLVMTYCGRTDRGKKRQSNQDHFLTSRLRKSMEVIQTSIDKDQHARFVSEVEGHLLMVADGMGGYLGGEVASEVVVDSAAAYVLNTIPWFYRLRPDAEDDFREELKSALEYCRRQLDAEAAANPDFKSMGTTLTMAYVVGQNLYVVHVGDSRCYLQRADQLYQLTRDHTLARMLADEGQLPAEFVDHSPLSHVLLKAVGGSPNCDLNPDVYKCQITAGDQLLLCTDGLTRHVSDEAIKDVLSQNLALEDKCHELIDRANGDGGLDNITVVVAFLESQGRSPLPKDAGAVEQDLHRELADTTPYQSPSER